METLKFLTFGFIGGVVGVLLFGPDGFITNIIRNLFK